MLSPTVETLRLFLHVAAAAVWIGCQLVVRRTSIITVAWPAFVVVVITGIWGLMAVDFSAMGGDWQGTVMIKILLATIGAMFVAVHHLGRTRLAVAVGGGLGLACSVGALFLGVLLRAHG